MVGFHLACFLFLLLLQSYVCVRVQDCRLFRFVLFVTIVLGYV